MGRYLICAIIFKKDNCTRFIISFKYKIGSLNHLFHQLTGSDTDLSDHIKKSPAKQFQKAIAKPAHKQGLSKKKKKGKQTDCEYCKISFCTNITQNKLFVITVHKSQEPEK